MGSKVRAHPTSSASSSPRWDSRWGGSDASTERIAVTCSAPIAVSATAAAVAGSTGGVACPVRVRPGSTSAAVSIRRRASILVRFCALRNSSTSVTMPCLAPSPRAVTSRTTPSIST